MIQRIQSIYLLLAAVLMAATAFSPIFLMEGQTLFAFGIKEGEEIIKPTWGIIATAGLSSFFSLVAIFMFKNRKGQSKIATSSAALIVLFYATALIYMLSYYNDFFGVLSSVGYGVVLPFLAFIFILLAKRGIKKDEKLVRSLDRIR